MIELLWRNKLLGLCLLLGILVGSFFMLSVIYSNYYGHMRNDEALNTFQTHLPFMPPGTIPVGGGIEVLRRSDPRALINPLPINQAVLEQGRNSYLYYCVQCHGPRLDGKATVGQSFYPLPTDLLGPQVQSQSDGELFYKISLGYKREPPLYATVAVADRWAVIRYLRALAEAKAGRRRTG
jgi:mono/diheme cytochrome c family protein